MHTFLAGMAHSFPDIHCTLKKENGHILTSYTKINNITLDSRFILILCNTTYKIVSLFRSKVGT